MTYHQYVHASVSQRENEDMDSTTPNIVIIGGGAGGLELATQLGH